MEKDPKNIMKDISTINRNSKYYQGKFTPRNPEKYIGNVDNIIFRSSLELSFMKKIDLNPNIVRWGSEEFYIPYVSIDNRVHRYFVDFILVENINGVEVTYLIEIKPHSQSIEPKKPKRKTKRFLYECMTYEVNKSKWKAAEQFCKERGFVFKIITEKDLISKKG